MKLATARFKIQFVEDFKETCSKLEIKQFVVFKKAMQEDIDKAESVKD